MFSSPTRSSSLGRHFALPFLVLTHTGASVIRALLFGFTLMAIGATAPFADAQKAELSVDVSKAGAKIERSPRRNVCTIRFIPSTRSYTLRLAGRMIPRLGTFYLN